MRRFWKISGILCLLIMMGCHKSSPLDNAKNAYLVINVPLKSKIGQEIKEGPLVEELHFLQDKAHISDKITLKKFDDFDYSIYGDGNATIQKTNDGNAVIAVSKYFYDGRAPREIIQAVLAHEMGHWKHKHCDKSNSVFNKQNEKKEAQADSFSIQLVGKEVFYKGFKQFGKDFYSKEAQLGYRLKRMRYYGMIK